MGGNLFGGGGQNGQSPVTINTQGSALPRTQAILAQRFGINAVPQGTDPNAYLDNILSQILGGGQ